MGRTITDEKLAEMQAARREQHRAKIKHNVVSVLEERQGVMEERESLMAKVKSLTGSLQELNEALDESGVEYYKPKEPKPVKPKPPIIILPDLMAAMLKTDATDTPQPPDEAISQIPTEVVAKFLNPKMDKMSHPIQKPCHVPNPVDRKITRIPELPDEPQKIVRHKAVYDNHKSYYGIYAELQKEWLKKSG